MIKELKGRIETEVKEVLGKTFVEDYTIEAQFALPVSSLAIDYKTDKEEQRIEMYYDFDKEEFSVGGIRNLIEGEVKTAQKIFITSELINYALGVLIQTVNKHIPMTEKPE